MFYSLILNRVVFSMDFRKNISLKQPVCFIEFQVQYTTQYVITGSLSSPLEQRQMNETAEVKGFWDSYNKWLVSAWLTSFESPLSFNFPSGDRIKPQFCTCPTDQWFWLLQAVMVLRKLVNEYEIILSWNYKQPQVICYFIKNGVRKRRETNP